MMTNLFSIFDPTSSQITSNWVSGSFFLLIWAPVFYVKSSILNLRISPRWSSKESSSLAAPAAKHLSLLFCSIFTLIVANNVLGLLPWNFTSTSHLSLTFALALPVWLTYTLAKIFLKTSKTMAHLMPEGSPSYLAPFMVIVETLSLMIRPVTLAVRLTANMIAGHLLIVLLSSAASIFSGATVLILASELLLLVLEMAVAVIQAYVFVILSTLYCNEV